MGCHMQERSMGRGEDSCVFRMLGDSIDYTVGSVWSWRGYCLVIQLDCGHGRRGEEEEAGSRDAHNHEIGIPDSWLDMGPEGEGT